MGEVCVHFLCLQSVVFAFSFVSVKEEVYLGAQLSGEFEVVPALKCS